MTTIRLSIAAALRAAAYPSRRCCSGSDKPLTGAAASVLAASLWGFCGVAAVQQAPATAQAGASPAAPNACQSGAVQLAEVTVTGSRIKRTTDFNTPTPTTVIDSGTMESLGIDTLGLAWRAGFRLSF